MIERCNLSKRKFLEKMVAIPIAVALPSLKISTAIAMPPLRILDSPKIKHVFQKGDTIHSLKKFYGDSRNYKEIAGRFNPENIPIGAEIVFKVDYEKFRMFGLYPDDSNWYRISEMSGDEFSKFLDAFGYKEHIRLVQGLIPGNYEKNFKEQLANVENFSRKINESSKEHRIDPLYHAAIGITESGLRTKTISPTGPIGAWGLSKYIFNESSLGPRINPYNKEESTKRSAAYLSHLKKKYYKKDKEFNSNIWVTAYNAGETVIDKLLRKTRDRGNLDEIMETRFKGFGPEQARYAKIVKNNLNKISKYFVVSNGKILKI